MALRDTASLLVGLLLLFHTWGARADVEVNMEDKVEVYNGETAQITCMYTSEEGIGGTMIQWFYVTRANEKQRIYFQDSTIKIIDRDTDFTDRISVNGTGGAGAVVLTISPVQLQDEGEFICLIKGLTEGTGEGRTKLKVFETPQLPTIEGVQTGISVNEAEPSKIGTCEVKNGYPKPNITWYKDNTPLRPILDEVHVVSTSTHSSGLFSVKSDLSMKVEKEDKDAKFYCEVTYYVPGETRMTETSRINVTVYYPPTAVNIWVESPKGKIKEGDSIELQCSGNGNSPFSVFTIKKTEDESSWDGNTALLENVTRSNGGIYECISMDMETLEEVSRNTSVFVNYLDSAVLRVKDSNEVPLGGGLEATCNALSSLQTETVWLKDGEEVARGHTLILKDATFDTAGTYMCVVTVPEIEGMTTSEAFRVYVQGPPEIMEQDTDLESYDSTIDLTCHVRGFPVPTIVWTASDGKDVKTVSQTDTESVARVPVASDITVFCNASNEYGTDAVTFNIKAIKPETATPSEKRQKESNGVIIAVIILCILLLAILGSVLYFLYKKGKICGRSGKQDLTKEKSNKDNIVVEMKSDNTEEAILLGVNGEKLPPSDQ